jgi:alanine dehydrogenase
MLVHLNALQIRTALPWPALIAALRRAFMQEVNVPRRHVHPVSADPASVLLLMPVWQAQRHLGVKLVMVAPDNPRRDLPTVHSIFMLFDAATGVPLAMLDGEELTLRRTAAASALAAGWLARANSQTLLVVGTGALAPAMAAAHAAMRPLRRILVWGRNAAKADDAAQRVQKQLENDGLHATVETVAVSGLAAAAGSADIITCATTSKTPILQAAWLAPGTHVDLVGGFRPDMREADDALMGSASVFVDTYAGALAEAGDLLQPIANGSLKRESIQAELADLARGRHAGRADAHEITVFKSVGTALEDLCAAELAWLSWRAEVGPD